MGRIRVIAGRRKRGSRRKASGTEAQLSPVQMLQQQMELMQFLAVETRRRGGSSEKEEGGTEVYLEGYSKVQFRWTVRFPLLCFLCLL